MMKMSMSMNPNDEVSQTPTESKELAVREPEIASHPGVIAELGKLGAGAVVTEQGVAQLFNRCTVSVKRAVIRGELPPPCRLFGSNAWTVGALVGHIERRLGEAAAKSQKLANKIRQLNP